MLQHIVAETPRVSYIYVYVNSKICTYFKCSFRTFVLSQLFISRIRACFLNIETEKRIPRCTLAEM